MKTNIYDSNFKYLGTEEHKEPKWLLISRALQHVQQLTDIADDLPCLDKSVLEEMENTLLKQKYEDIT